MPRRKAEGRRNGYNLLDVIPQPAGPRIATPRGGAFHSIRPPGSQTFLAQDHCVGIMLAPAPRFRATLGSDRPQIYDAPTGAIAIAPANVDSTLVWPTSRENAIIAITPESLQELAALEFDAADVELQPPPFGAIDPWALRIAQMLKAELNQREVPNELYVDSLITIFAIHMLRHYSGVRTPPPTVQGGLSRQSAGRVQDFLADNFSRKLSVAELAEIAGLPPRRFIQAFTRTFGEPPHRHIVGLRLSFAEKLLIQGELTIAEVAYLSGFSSQSHLTTAMRTARQTTPRAIRGGR
ncbi:AraC family transcriptional regulator [Inquilinus limosus MP06]|uniref:AraC family transcriptional regulator n=2 Tax=Inquilinus limosus TaxID=171674 RepID=A0A0A0D4K9_9PROT|nr:AraC family transcriptional regulator [Inquilinus limosus MP06]